MNKSILSIPFEHETVQPSTNTVVRYYAFSSTQMPEGNQWTVSILGRVSNMVENPLRIAVVVGDHYNDTAGTVVIDTTLAPGADRVFVSDEGALDPVALFGSSIRYLKICAFYTGATHPYFNAHTLTMVGSIRIPTPVALNDIELLTHNSLLLSFAKPLLNNSTLQDPATYTITPETDGNTVTVTEVRTGSDLLTDKIVLVFTEPSLGSVYTLAVAPTVSYSDGSQATLPARFQFEDRRTKMDILLQQTPNVYDTGTSSTMRWLLQAFAQADERIGGTRSDLLGVL